MLPSLWSIAWLASLQPKENSPTCAQLLFVCVSVCLTDWLTAGPCPLTPGLVVPLVFTCLDPHELSEGRHGLWFVLYPLGLASVDIEYVSYWANEFMHSQDNKLRFFFLIPCNDSLQRFLLFFKVGKFLMVNF